MKVTISPQDSSRRVLVKRAESDDEAVHLRREADLLEVATHPGLVELVAFRDGAEPELTTAYVDGPTLASDVSLAVEEVAGTVAAVASTLADLHDVSLVHGALVPEHVVVDRDGRPILCSLGYGGLAGERRPGRPLLDRPFPETSGDDPDVLDPATDVFAVGALLAVLLSRLDQHSRGSSAESLRQISAEATSAVPADRPSARQLADAVHDAVAHPRLFRAHSELDGDEPDPLAARRLQRPLEQWRRAQIPTPPFGRRRLGSHARGVLAAVALVALAAGGFALVVGARDGGTVAAGPPVSPSTSHLTAAPAPTSQVGSVPPSTTVVAPRPSTGCPPLDASLSADVDGDGCAEAVQFTDGVVQVGSSRWSVGTRGDVPALGDWACSGRRSLAVLRPSSGEVFAFDGWATADREVRAALVGQVPGGSTLRAADLDGDGCHELLVEREAGAPAVLRAGRARP